MSKLMDEYMSRGRFLPTRLQKVEQLRLALLDPEIPPTRKESSMKNEITSARRQFIKIGGMTMAAIPLLVLTNKAAAATNAGMRSAMKYQDTPNAGKACAECTQFVPGKTASGPGGCKIFPGDTEVSPTGYCVAWASKPK